MLKFLLIVGLIFYVIYRVAGFFFKAVFLSAQQRAQNNPYTQQRQSQTRPRSGNLNIDYMPKDKKSKDDFKGGDYVDFEEVS
ncbi:MAG: DUF4834 family protein [Cyclobacteriaceae bacterium]